jgi:small-conductance mechanosensitive channel
MARVYEWLQLSFGLTDGEINRIFASIATVFIASLLRALILRLVYRRTDDVRVRYQWRKAVTYIIVPITILALIRIWFGGSGSLLTYFGLVSAGVAIALREPLVNLAGWGFILWRRPFVVGDRIEVNGMRGDVIDLRIFQLSLMEIGNWVDADQSTGRIVHVPNGVVFTAILANYTQGLKFIWHEIPVVVTFESDWRKAHEILTRIVNEHATSLTEEAQQRVRRAAETYMIFFTNLTPIVYTKVLDHGVALTLRYLCDPRKRRGSEDGIWRAILEEFANHDDIEFAYPTTRFFDATKE